MLSHGTARNCTAEHGARHPWPLLFGPFLKLKHSKGGCQVGQVLVKTGWLLPRRHQGESPGHVAQGAADLNPTAGVGTVNADRLAAAAGRAR